MFYVFILFFAVLFIRRVAGPVLKPIFVSSSLTKMDRFVSRPSPRSWYPQISKESSESTCVSCGNIKLENAKFCAFCGYEFTEEDEEVRT